MKTDQVPQLLTDLANMGENAVQTFRGKWWHFYQHPRLPSDARLLKYRDELRLLWLNVSKPPVPPEIPPRAKDLFEDWTQEERTLEEHVCGHWLVEPGRKWKIEWTRDTRRISPNPAFLPGMLAFGCVEYGNRLAYCWNPDCVARFFIGDRKGRKFCSPACAKPAKRAAKRKWWRENRGTAAKRKDYWKDVNK